MAVAQRRTSIIEASLRDVTRWRAFVRALDQKLPGYRVTDYTIPLPHEPSFVAVISSSAPSADTTLVIHVSMLAPLYMLYERHQPHAGAAVRYRYRISADLGPIVAAVEQAMAAHDGYERMDPQLAEVQILGIAVGNSLYGRATIADALFGDRRF